MPNLVQGLGILMVCDIDVGAAAQPLEPMRDESYFAEPPQVGGI